MSVLTLNVDEVMRTLSAESSNPFVVHDKEVDIVRFAINSGFADIVLDGQVALRVMYQRPGETEVRAQTLTYYDTDGLHNFYDWQLLSADLAEKGTLTVALCILRTDSEVEEWHTTPCQIRVLDTIHTDDSDEADETITPTVAQRVAVLETMIQRVASGAPIVVASTSAMTDTDQIYVLSTDGNWYYHNGTTWVSGGTYGAVATDTTLAQSGIPADAEAVGGEISILKNNLDNVASSAFDNTSVDLTFVQGSINSTNGELNSTNLKRCRTNALAVGSGGARIYSRSRNFKFNVYEYVNSGTTSISTRYVGKYTDDWVQDITVYVTTGHCVRIVYARNDTESTLSPTDIADDLCIINRDVTDTSLSKQGKAADAKVVGDILKSSNKNILEFYVEKGGWTTAGVKTAPNNVKSIRADRIFELTPDSLLQFYIDDGWTYTARFGDTPTQFDVEYHLSTDANIIVPKAYMTIQFNEFVDGESINVPVTDFDNSIVIETSGIATYKRESVETHDLPTSAGQLNVVFRAYQLSKIEYETKAVLPMHKGGTNNLTIADAPEGANLFGAPYSSMRDSMAYIPQAVSLHSFRTMIENPNSYIYTRHYEAAAPHYDYNARCYFGAVCSSLVAWCYGIDDVLPTTISFGSYPGMNPLPSAQQTPQSLRLADMLNRSNSHIVIVTDVIRNERGRVKKIEITEAYPPRCRSQYLTPEKIQSSYLNNGYTIYRYDNLDSVTYHESSWVHVDNTETDTPTYNTIISPRRGEQSNWALGEVVEIDVLDNTSEFTECVVVDRSTNQSVLTQTIPQDNVIQLSGLLEGRYYAYLANGDLSSSAVYFDVVDAEATYVDLGNHTVRVEFESATNRTPSAVYWCCNKVNDSDFKAVRAFHILTPEEVAQGYAIVEEPTSLRPTDTTNGNWFMRMSFKTKYGLFASDLVSVHVADGGNS